MKKVLVVGGSSGIGKGIAIEMAKNGFEVTVLARDKEKLEDLKYENCKLNLSCYSVDVNNDAELDAFVYKYDKTIDILINAIGGVYGIHGDFESLSLENWKEAYNINLFLTVKMVQVFLPHLKNAKESLIINISSLAGERPGRFNPHYGSAKASLNYLTKYLAKTFGVFGVRCVSIAPSTLDDETLSKDAEDYALKNSLLAESVRKDFVLAAKNKNPINRLGSIDEVARMAVFITSVPSINGISIVMDSGEMA